MMNLITKIQENGGKDKKGQPYGKSTLSDLQKFLDGKLQLDKLKAVSMMTKIEEKADELGIE